MKWMLCLILSLTFTSSMLAQSAAACNQTLAAPWSPPSTHTWGYGASSPVIPLLAQGGIDVYGVLEDTPPSWAKHWLIVVYQSEAAREQEAGKLAQQYPAGSDLQAFWGDMKYEMFSVVQPYGTPVIDTSSATFYIPPQCVTHPQSFFPSPGPTLTPNQIWVNGGIDISSLYTAMILPKFSDHLTPLENQAYLKLLQKDQGAIETEFQQTVQQAQQGNVKAQDALACAYRDGQWMGESMPPRDYTKAAYWFLQAANQGDRDAQISLGRMYANFPEWRAKGQPAIPKNDGEVYFWYGIVVAEDLRNGVFGPNDASYIDDGASLTPQQLSEEKARIARWMDTHFPQPSPPAGR